MTLLFSFNAQTMAAPQLQHSLKNLLYYPVIYRNLIPRLEHKNTTNKSNNNKSTQKYQLKNIEAKQQ